MHFFSRPAWASNARIIVGSAAALFILASTSAQSQQVWDGSTSKFPIGDAKNAASSYSDANRAIGIVVYEGSGNAVTGHSVGQQFVDELRRRQVQSRYFLVRTNKKGMAVAYHIGALAEGPFSVQQAASKMGEIVRTRHAVTRMLNETR